MPSAHLRVTNADVGPDGALLRPIPSHVKYLECDDCTRLKTLPSGLDILENLRCQGCPSLRRFPPILGQLALTVRISR